MGVPVHLYHGMVLLDGTPRRGGTNAIYIFMAPLTLFNEAPKRKSVAPMALKNAFLWLSWPSLMRGTSSLSNIWKRYWVFICDRLFKMRVSQPIFNIGIW